jgi:Protein of unknown function (DUF2946)
MTWTSLPLQKLSLWVLCVMLLGALAPTMSRARAWSHGTQVVWVEVCSADGARQVVQDSAPSDTPTPSLPGMTTLDHCGLCVLSADRMAPPPQPFEWQALPQAPPALTVAISPFSLAVLHWTVYSRAPPACV